MHTAGGKPFPLLSVSASRQGDSALVSATNLDPIAEHSVSLDLRGARIGGVSAQILTAGELDAHNTVEDPEAVAPQPFSDVVLDGDLLTVVLPRASYVTVALELPTDEER